MGIYFYLKYLTPLDLLKHTMYYMYNRSNIANSDIDNTLRRH